MIRSLFLISVGLLSLVLGTPEADARHRSRDNCCQQTSSCGGSYRGRHSLFNRSYRHGHHGDCGQSQYGCGGYQPSNTCAQSTYCAPATTSYCAPAMTSYAAPQATCCSGGVAVAAPMVPGAPAAREAGIPGPPVEPPAPAPGN